DPARGSQRRHHSGAAMHVLTLVPDGVGVRNFVLGRFLSQASRSADVSVMHLIPPSLLPVYSDQANARVNWYPFLPYRDAPLAFTLRYALSYAQMHWVGTRAMRYHLRHRPATGSWRTRSADKVSRVAGRLAASPTGLQMLDRWHQAVVRQVPSVDQYVDL